MQTQQVCANRFLSVKHVGPHHPSDVASVFFKLKQRKNGFAASIIFCDLIGAAKVHQLAKTCCVLLTLRKEEFVVSIFVRGIPL